tara:strand:- start:542 stop:964 length:423 start_codon:yes stop_codon:yes gene_type:complete
MASSRLHEVLTIGMHAGAKRAHDGAPRGTLSDENDPIFLFMVKEAIHHELANLVDPPDPSAAYNEQQDFRASRFDAGFYVYSEEESIPRPAPEVVSTYETTILTNAERRARLKQNLAQVETKLRDAMSPALRNKYLSMLG